VGRDVTKYVTLTMTYVNSNDPPPGNNPLTHYTERGRFTDKPHRQTPHLTGQAGNPRHRVTRKQK